MIALIIIIIQIYEDIDKNSLSDSLALPLPDLQHTPRHNYINRFYNQQLLPRFRILLMRYHSFPMR